MTQKKDRPLIGMISAVDYEVRSSWWTPYTSWGWAREMTGTYFAWKVSRKYNRYLVSKHSEHHVADHNLRG